MIGKIYHTIFSVWVWIPHAALDHHPSGAFEGMEVSVPTAPLSLKELMERASWMPKNDVVVRRQRWGNFAVFYPGGYLYRFSLVFYLGEDVEGTPTKTTVFFLGGYDS